jgi:hypothetical protein
MKKVILSCVVVLLSFSLTSAAYITDALTYWTLGVNSPEISTGDRPTGDTGPYLHMLVGANAMYYEVMTGGEGSVDFWIYDPGKCLADPDPGYGVYGPVWGLLNPLYQAMTVGIIRKAYIQGCRGYNVYSTVAPYSPWWYMEFHGLRATDGAPFTPGWYRWSVNGTMDATTFTLYNITYFENGVGSNFVTGDLAQTINAASFDGISLSAAFGYGWKAFYISGDNSTGIEDINCMVTGGTGVFAEFGPSAAATPYIQNSWGGIKSLFK